MKLDFSDCVKRAKNGDAQAFSELYSLIYKDLYYVALSNLKNKDDACDVVSDAVLDAYKGLKNLKDVSAFKSWMMRILSIKIKKKQAEYIKNREFTSEMTEEVEDSLRDNEDHYSGFELIEQFDILSKTEKLVFSLSVISGYSSDEIAKIADLKPATVRSHLHRSREKLRKHLKNNQ